MFFIKRSFSKKLRVFSLNFAIAYTLFCITLYFQQQRLIFFPQHDVERTPSKVQLNYQDIWINISQEIDKAENIHGWWIPSKKSNAPVILYFHHNAINIGANVSQALQFHKLGYSIFLFDYRGFGQSQGKFPTESQVYEDAQAVWKYLIQERKIPASKIIIYGHSIGGAIAIDLAVKNPDAGLLIVQSSFTSMRDMTKRFGLFWLLPIDLILKQRFASLEKIKNIRIPVLIVTGTEDIQIPVAMSKRLYDAVDQEKELIIIQGGGHDNHMSKQYRNQMKAFIERQINQN